MSEPENCEECGASLALPCHLFCGPRIIARRLRAFAATCIENGDMTPAAGRALNKIADEIEE